MHAIIIIAIAIILVVVTGNPLIGLTCIPIAIWGVGLGLVKLCKVIASRSV